MVDHQLGVASDQEPPRSHLDHDLETVDKGLIFGDVVGGIEVKANSVVEFVPLG